MKKLSRILDAFGANAPGMAAGLYGRVRCRARSADILQDAWIRLAELGTDGAVENPQAYVRRTVRNAATDHLRKERRRAAIDQEVHDLLWDSADEMSPERIAIGREAVAALGRALAEMPEQSRRVFLMNRFEGRTHRQIARDLGVSETTVYYHIRRVLERLSELRDSLAD
ncbi:RNA polymerase sigma factor [Inquilinus sp. Marseille-Q2685]|uniref:RNA polymerase sigma factor n=1 Tax=Inquilinus sp. Marseille-Q2685 TaxID=2866581 RepID=UPI001CE4A0A2|nr:sigma-70 family RNA polymerase sigma factor [Inquilinus sp. Marseille-Q2685]